MILASIPFPPYPTHTKPLLKTLLIPPPTVPLIRNPPPKPTMSLPRQYTRQIIPSIKSFSPFRFLHSRTACWRRYSFSSALRTVSWRTPAPSLPHKRLGRRFRRYSIGRIALGRLSFRLWCLWSRVCGGGVGRRRRGRTGGSCSGCSRSRCGNGGARL